MIFQLTGGIGLFLLGMVLLTDGLKAFAGEALRRALVKFTGTPGKAFASGTLVTLLIQSSSATTVTVIGFVSAGLLTFSQAVGVVMGASLGTTGTGWIVSVLGLKISVGFYALPLVGAGAFLKLLGRGRWKSLGVALAGFGLIFVGIEYLQTGMQGVAGRFQLASLPSGGLWGHLLAMLIGVVMTLIMQSSSAAVATTLTALHTNSVNFEQAASLVIGAAIGTTVTGALAAIGGSVSAKRTALAHVSFNLATGLIAVVLLPVFLWGIRWAQEHAGLDAGATSLAAFHTSFIAVGVLLFLPIVDRFSALIERILPEKGASLTRHLDNTLLAVPTVALEASRRALSDIAREMLAVLQDKLTIEGHESSDGRVELIREAMDTAQHFFARIPAVSEDVPISHFRVAQLHAIDHLSRLQSRLNISATRQEALRQERLRPVVERAQRVLTLGIAGLEGRAQPGWVDELERLASELAALRRQERPILLRETAGQDKGPAQALEVLDAIRWLDRVGYHTWRACNYLGGDGKPEPAGFKSP
jgi:phosphate:Na+ symporter